MNVLLSYPRSGNHLARFFIELLTEKPTFGCEGSKTDVPIYQNVFPESIPFNITSLTRDPVCYVKYHNVSENLNPKDLIFLIRNPREVLLRHNDYKFIKEKYDLYFSSIKFYKNFKNKKIHFFYEDLIKEKTTFINSLSAFLEKVKAEKKAYALKNLEKLYELSKKGKNRAWGGVNSEGPNFYYKRITDLKFKKQFDDYLAEKMEDPTYDLIKLRYFQ